MVHGGADLVKGVVTHPGIHLRRDIGREVPQRLAGEQVPQVHRQQPLYRLAPLGHLFRLQLADGLHHGGAQQLRHCHTVGLGALLQRRGRDHQGHKILEAVLLRRTGQVPRGGLLAAGLYVSGIAQEAVLQLLGVRLLQPAQHAVPGGDGQAVFLAEILRQQRLEEGQSAGAVGQRVEKFHREPVMIDQYPKGALPHLMKGDVGQRAAFFLLNGGGVGDLLQIVPERAAPQPHRN